jgi:AAHS family 4-hydroxybenzoate transporter-like MFS transporter
MSHYDVKRVLTLRGRPLIVTLITTTILVLDGLDIQIISLVAPLLTHEFQIAPVALGPVFAAALVGMAIGGFGLGGMGDRWGRRPALLLSVVLFAVSTLVAAGADRIEMLVIWRLLTGIGLGGAIPNAMALLAEFTGPRWRTEAVAAAVVGVPLGGMLGAATAGYVLPMMGWRAMFVIGGLLPLMLAGVTFFLLPESPLYLAVHPERRNTLVAALNRWSEGQSYSSSHHFDLGDALSVSGRVSDWALIGRSLRRDTFALRLIFLTNMFTVYTFFSWSPVILSSFNLPLRVAIRGSLIFNLAGVSGGVSTAWLISRVGSRGPSVALAIIGVVTLVSISQTLSSAAAAHMPFNLTSLMAGIAVVGFVMIGIQTAAYRLSTWIYPTQLRASGVGWASSLGRAGGILSSFIAGWILGKVHGAGLFATLAGAIFATLLGALMIRRHLPALGGRADS